MSTISVVIPVHNGEKHLAECLQSVLNNTRAPEQVLVIDDGSEDGTAAVAARFPQVDYVRQPQAGASAARNLGVSRARGEWIAFLDADDLATPQRLERQSLWLRNNPAVDGVFGGVEQFSDPPGIYPYDAIPQSAMLPGAFTARASILARVGAFCVDYQAAEFIDWCLRAQELGARFESVPELVLRRRVHATNSGRLRREARQDYARVVMSALRRRRGS